MEWKVIYQDDSKEYQKLYATKQAALKYVKKATERGFKNVRVVKL